ncbi:MAG: YlbF family regulator [Ruminococcaceae bacterium]|nr:YlbF family regulator [Oscillospiraceae bacterium]
MEIFELAAELGKALRKDERLVRLENAKKAYEGDKDLQKLMIEYEVQQKALQHEITKEERDTMFIDVIQKRIDELYKAIMEHPIFEELNEAQAEVNILMNEVNGTITYNITGEKPSACTGSCSTCGGGCH